jgi:hypothetical protein
VTSSNEVDIDAECKAGNVMDDTKESLRTRLEKFGDPRKTWKWQSGEVDYVAQFELTSADVPELLAIAREWAEPKEWPDDKDYVAGYAPVHAWRGLAQLGATAAIPLLLEMMDPLGESGDDWYLEEFPHAFAWIGPAALAPLRDYLADDKHGVYARIAAAHALRELAGRHPQTRDDVVIALRDALSRFQATDESLNAFIISYLLELKATDAAELIEQAHAADRVDIMVNGNWNHVRQELGVAGLGLVPEELAGRRAFPDLFSRFSLPPLDDSDDDVAPKGGHAKNADYLPVDEVTPPIRTSGKVGRNEPCPCGSGKKYKKCCGKGD